MRRLCSRVVRVVAAGAMLALLTGSARAVSDAEYGPVRDTIGAAGIGDPYYPDYGNGGYRVRHYAIRVGFDPTTERLRGVTAIRARATQRLTRFNFDLMLPAAEVTVDGERAAYRQRTHELVVWSPHPIRDGQRIRIRVRYAGVPKNLADDGIRPWVTTAGGALAVGQPEIAAWWFPSNDHPADRASFDVRITVPRGRQAISNGWLAGVRRTDTTTTWHWTMRDPMATYLAFAAIGRYELIRGTTPSGRRYLYAIDKHLLTGTKTRARQAMRRTAPITQFLAGTWGRYPFGPIGGVVPKGDIGYALENQTRPVYDPAFFAYGAGTRVVVHEMAHQWFGDAVALRRWRHIWLNEGFATYSEWLWAQHRGGETANHRFHRIYRSKGPASPFWDLRIGDPGPSRLFANPVYVRGALTVHALRLRVGSATFFRICREWVQHNADGLGTTGEFRRLAERISGERLGGLFRAWLFSGNRPPLPS